MNVLLVGRLSKIVIKLNYSSQLSSRSSRSDSGAVAQEAALDNVSIVNITCTWLEVRAGIAEVRAGALMSSLTTTVTLLRHVQGTTHSRPSLCRRSNKRMGALKKGKIGPSRDAHNSIIELFVLL